ncbi:putative pentatricopeptide repeat-containing protein At5g37570 isoform X2 [Mercurialis annua]|uniref:putative pentatricopeptide repeat-containing protein At5g37570 isoform X2 n=1 Tax=Mercurialis annua TaxID=3986 RepID=UPI00215F5581|nr:putative pentatricopeptide repeat-containing protein At5g37570 isoform X2 [Mercurialis annua]
MSDPSIRTLIYSCKTIAHLHQLHARIIRQGLEQDHFIISNFLNISTSITYSTSVFNSVNSPSTILYNVIFKFYAHKCRFEEAMSLYVRMKKSEYASPDKYTYPQLIRLCSNDRRLKEGEGFHGSVIRIGLGDDLYVGSSLVDFYGKCKEILSARKVFDEMPQRNVVSWTAMVVGYLNVGDIGNGMRVFDQMPERNVMSWNGVICGLVKAGDLRNASKVFDEMGERNVGSFTVMIDGYAKAGDMISARELFEKAPEVDIVAWSALISGYTQNGQPDEAVKMFLEMELKNVMPDEYVMVSLMSACSQLGSLDLAKRVDCYLSRSSIDIEQSHVIAALIDMNVKCGNIDRAKTLFEQMHSRDLVTYCSMIHGLSIHGCSKEAVGLFNRMLNEKVIPDEAAFTVILTACSRGGLVEEGVHYFETMKDKDAMKEKRVKKIEGRSWI